MNRGPRYSVAALSSCTSCADACTLALVATRRLNVSLDQQRAAKLARLADRIHVADGSLARSLLSTAIDNADPDPESITQILEGIPGLAVRLERAEAEVASGATVELRDL